MFAKLKKKIEDEVGDLGQLTSPLANPFGAAADRRVGGSSQGSNTPNNLGSRQSSVASLVDLHPIDEHTTSSNAGLNVPSSRTSNSAVAARQKQQEATEADLKKINTEWTKKFEAMKKAYEERIQNQEADFAWKYSAKDDDLERVRIEKKKLEDTVKSMEGAYQNKMTRVQDDMDQLEGFTKQEMAKVKHLLLNTQADLQKAKGELVESESKVKEISEENRNLKAENDSILRNLDRDRLQRVKFDSDHGDTKTQMSDLQTSKQQLENEIRTLKEDILSKNKRIEEFEAQTKRQISEKQGETDALERISLELKEHLKTEKLNASNLSQQVSELQNSKLQLENDVKVLQEDLRSKSIVATHLQELVKQSNSEKVNDITKLQAAVALSAEEVELLKTNLKAKESEIQSLEQSHQIKISQSSAETSEEMSRLRTSYHKLESKFQILSKDLQTKQAVIDKQSDLNNDLARIRDAKEKIESEFNIVAAERETLEKRMSEAVLQQTESENEIRQLQARVTELNNTVLKGNSERTDFLSEVETYRSLKSELEAQIEQLGSEVTSKQEIIDDLRRSTMSEAQSNSLDDLRHEITELTNKVKQSSVTESELLSQIDVLKDSKLECDNLTAKLREEIEVKNQQVTEIQAKFHQTEAEITERFQQKISALETQIEKSSGLGEKCDKFLIQVNELQNSKLQLKNEVVALNESIKERDQKLENASHKLNTKISELESELSEKTLELAEFDEIRKSKQILEIQVIELNEDINAKQDKLTKFQEASLQSEKQTDQLHHTLAELEVRLNESSERTGNLQVELDQIKNSKIKLQDEIAQAMCQLDEKDQRIDGLQNQSKNNGLREMELLEEVQTLKTLKSELENRIEELSAEKLSETSVCEFQQQISKLETQVRNTEIDLSEQNDLLVQVGELQSTKDELEEEIKFLKEEVQVRDLKISALEEKNSNSVNNTDSSVETQPDQNEEIESLRERVRELESQLGDKNKALKLRQQQLQDLKKSLAKEIRNTPGDSISKSASQTSLRELETPIRSEESSLAETEPAIIQSLNSHSTEASNCSTEDVNFQYMKSVIFKYVTSSDPQMTHHLTKVVSTLLHLNDEEQRLLQKSTDRRLLGWLGTRDHIL